MNSNIKLRCSGWQFSLWCRSYTEMPISISILCNPCALHNRSMLHKCVRPFVRLSVRSFARSINRMAHAQYTHTQMDAMHWQASHCNPFKSNGTSNKPKQSSNLSNEISNLNDITFQLYAEWLLQSIVMYNFRIQLPDEILNCWWFSSCGFSALVAKKCASFFVHFIWLHFDAFISGCNCSILAMLWPMGLVTNTTIFFFEFFSLGNTDISNKT